MISLFSIEKHTSPEGLEVPAFHVTESGDGTLGVMSGSLWVAIPRDAEATLAAMLTRRNNPGTGGEPTPPEHDWNCGNHYLRQQWLFSLIERNPAIAISMPAQDELELIATGAGPAMCQIAIERWLDQPIEMMDSDIPF